MTQGRSLTIVQWEWEIDLSNEFWYSVWTTVEGSSWHLQEAVIKTIPKKKAKRLSEEALQVAEKRREAKGKGEKERYTRLNAEFQKIAGRENKALKVISQGNRGKQ